ncbi:nuclear transport factor 2 family protein [Pedobacter sp. SYP-B3415]|uniref:nuclear transport factor 2 family protein n=1 Tax=Pedobacter sp. SYP-B3415 TaxID=2496641 RepID=UPI00101C4204|nr:nuclear transport factor 2 family protein [Pedobacter sp. SYP-B3415]
MIQPQNIADLEEKLIGAIKNSDVALLDELLHDELLFTNHLAQVMTKEMDLESHRTGNLKIEHIGTSDQQIRLSNDCAVVAVKKRITGTYGGQAFDERVSFTRVWKRVSAGWKVIAAASVRSQELPT